MKIKKIGVLTGGGDCPGLNAVIRAVTKTAVNDYKMKLVGIRDGYEGLIKGDFRDLTYDGASGILTEGGTILGTSNKANPFKYPVKSKGRVVYKDLSDKVIKNAAKLGLQALVCIGGDGTMAASSRLSAKGLPVVGVPKTIDNDLLGTDLTFGFDSAVTTATEAIDKLHTTAQSHHRVMVVEVMGRYAGWLALESGLAGGGDVILIPEIPFDIKKVCKKIVDRGKTGRKFTIVVAAEGASPVGGKMVVKKIIKTSPDPIRLGGIGQVVGQHIEKITGVAARTAVLGHLQRGGTPTAFDRILATRLGAMAAYTVAKGKFGCMVALKGQDIVTVDLNEVSRGIRTVPLDSPIIKAARSVGTCFGD